MIWQPGTKRRRARMPPVSAGAGTHPSGADGAGLGGAGGLPISSMRPRTTSSRMAIATTTAAVGWPQKTKISAASATAPMRSTVRCA